MSRTIITCFLLFTILGLITVGVAADRATATHGEEITASELAETQTFTAENTAPGEVEVELSYHIGRDIEELEVLLPGDKVADVVQTDGLRETDDPDVYEWDQRTDQPSLRIIVEANESASLNGEPDAVGTNDWTLTQRLQTGFSWWAENPDEITWQRDVRTSTPGYVGDTMVYLGEYDRYTFESSEEQFQLIVSEYTDREISVNEIRDSIITTSDQLSVGEQSDQVTIYVVSSPIRSGGKAIGSDIWVHESGVAPVRPLLFHEYVHTRQKDSLRESARWTLEAEGEYYGYLLALQQGNIGYAEFHDRFEGADTRPEYSTVVLATPDTWETSTAAYDYGGLVIARQDAQIRNASGGARSYEDVLRAKNNHDGNVTHADLEGFVTAAAGADTHTSFVRYAQSEPETVEVPSPAELSAPENTASLEVTVGDVTVSPGDEATITIEILNTGSEESTVPYVQLPNSTDVPQIQGFRIQNRETVDYSHSDKNNLFVLNHIAPGKQVRIEYHIVVSDSAPIGDQPIRVTAADISGNQATANATLAVVEAATPTSTPTPSAPTSTTSGSTPTTASEMPGFGSAMTVLTFITIVSVFSHRRGR